MLKVYYDDYEVTRHFVLRKATNSLRAPQTSNYTKLQHLNGANFKYSTLGQIELKLEVTIKNDIQYHLDELNKVFSTKEPKKLVISDNPDRYLMCVLDGKTEFTSRFIASDATLTFVSPNHYWNGYPTYNLNYLSTEWDKNALPTMIRVVTQEDEYFSNTSDGRIMINNIGSSSTPPIFDINFTSDTGYLAMVAPEDHLALGNPGQLDKADVPPTETALNEEMHHLNGWTRITNVENWVPDYNKITSRGSAKHDEWGALVNPSTFTGLADNWQGHAYYKPFATGSIEQVANNFKLRSRIDMRDLSGNRDATAGLLIVVLDTDNRPIMTTSIYDVAGAVNKLATSFKINSFKDGQPNHSTIIHNGNIESLSGFVEMRKSGNQFDWLINTDTPMASTQPIKVGDVVKLKTTATRAATGHYYADSYRNREYTVRTINNWPGHTKQIYHLYIGNDVIYHVYLDDIELKTVTSVSGVKQIKHTLIDNNLAQLNPSKVLIWQGVWGNTTPYSRFSLNSVVVDRLYTDDLFEVPNVFRAGDNLYIDNATGDILLNGTTFNGYIDYDSRFFELEWGQTELQVQVSEWASMPDVKVYIEPRYL